MPIKCILFDADWVVINSEMFSVQFQKQYNVTNDEMLPFYLWEFKETIIWKTDLKQLLTNWLPKWKWNKTIDQFLDSWFKAEHSVDQEIVDSIKKLQNNWIKCFLATNQEKYRTKYMREEMWFEKLFDWVFSSCELGYKKPDEWFYLSVLDKIKNEYWINKEESLFFDDSEKNVNKANELWIKSYHYTNFQDYEKIINNI